MNFALIIRGWGMVGWDVKVGRYRSNRNDFNAWEDVVGPLKESLLDSEGARNSSLLEPSY